jgi:hypothetical protein
MAIMTSLEAERAHRLFKRETKLLREEIRIAAGGGGGGGTAQAVWIPPEVCKIVPGQYFNGKLPDDQTGRMILFTCKPPKENAEAIENVGLPRLGLKGHGNGDFTIA